VVADERDARLRVEEQRVGGTVPRPVQDGELQTPGRDDLAVLQLPGVLHRAHGADQALGGTGGVQQRVGSPVPGGVRLGPGELAREVLPGCAQHVADGGEGEHRRPRPLRQLAGQADVVGVVVREENLLDGVEGAARRREPRGQRGEGARERHRGVDEGGRARPAEQVHVDPVGQAGDGERDPRRARRDLLEGERLIRGVHRGIVARAGPGDAPGGAGDRGE
jgi:hypothetical protein